MKRRPWIRAWLFLALVVWACGGTSSSGGDSETHWLTACNSDADCSGDGTCLCGMCTTSCSISGGCGEVSNDAVCLEQGSVDRCADQASPPARLCVEQCDTAADCDESFSCLSGLCVKGSAPFTGSDASTDTSTAGSAALPDAFVETSLLESCLQPGTVVSPGNEVAFLDSLVGRWLTCNPAPNFLGDSAVAGLDIGFDLASQEYVFYALYGAGTADSEYRWSNSPSAWGTVRVPGLVIGETREIDFDFASGDRISVLMSLREDPKKMLVIPGDPAGIMPSSYVHRGSTPPTPVAGGGGFGGTAGTGGSEPGGAGGMAGAGTGGAFTAGTGGTAGAPDVPAGDPVSNSVVSPQAIAACEGAGGVAYRGLCWENPPPIGLTTQDSPFVDFDSAVRHCDTLNAGGYVWSVPTAEELYSLMVFNRDCGMRCIPVGGGVCDWFYYQLNCGFTEGPGRNGCYMHPNFEGECSYNSYYWTSTDAPSESGVEASVGVNFASGQIGPDGSSGVFSGAIPRLGGLAVLRCVSHLEPREISDGGVGGDQ